MLSTGCPWFVVNIVLTTEPTGWEYHKVKSLENALAAKPQTISETRERVFTLESYSSEAAYFN
jgi:hypothetical protein